MSHILVNTGPRIADEFMIEMEGDRIRVCPWRGDAGKALLIPAPGHIVSVEAIRRCVEEVAMRGYRSVLTSALSPNEQEPFRSCSFETCENLYLLAHDLRTIPNLTGPVGSGFGKHPRIRLRRGRRRDATAVLDLDGLAFDPFWRFDRFALEDALTATPKTRWRVADEEGVIGYAITGRSGTNAYLQRLAVHPHNQSAGIGSNLVLDSLRWAKRRRVSSLLVNTQESNDRAMSLYEGLGFVLEPAGLAVLVLEVGA